MTDHDPLCVTPYKQQATCASCVLVARVRADERERVITTLIDASGIGNVIAAAATAHAEALVLADLRAKVEGLRDQSLEGFRREPHRSHLGTMASTLERVLTLIEEVDRG